ncbi:MAG: ferrous iron transport protein B [bacterium]
MNRKPTVALAGNPNSGKTSIFNELTGSHQYVGNWPGVTVEKKEGKFTWKGYEINVVDLPGTYSLSAYSIDETIARNFIVEEQPDAVIVVIDSSNLARNLYLALEVLELGANVILDLNMIDEAERKGLKIDIEKISSFFNVPVVETVAVTGKGIQHLKETIIEAIGIKRNEFKIDYGEEIEREIEHLSEFIKSEKVSLRFPLRWFIIKLLEGDTQIIKEAGLLDISDKIEKKLQESMMRLEKQLDSDVETFIVEKRYGIIEGLIKECVERQIGIEERLTISDKIDKIVTNKYLGIPIFLLMMWLTFQLVFKLGEPIVGIIELFFDWLGKTISLWFTSIGLPNWIISLVRDGIISGVGSVLVFLPNILLLFLAISILEDSGYMARVAFVMDRLMHALGLHGKSFIPMILGFGCNVPAIMACRTLESEKDRILTILVIPLMSCTARLPIYALFASVFFPKNQGWVIFSLYVLGIVLAILVARIFKRIFFKHEVAPLIMELPPYRLPQIKGVFIHMWERGSQFLKKAGSIIFAGVVIIWLLASLPFGVEYASGESLIGRVGNVLAPLLKPAGFGFWQAGVALFFGLLAKEVVIGTLGTVYGVGETGLTGAISQNFTSLSAYSFMVMSLIYIPCIATIGVIKRETNWKWTGLAIGYSLILGWILAVLIYQIGKLFL